MANRIPRTFIDDLITRCDLVHIIEQHVPLKKAGHSYKGLCPFHTEKSPSFTVSSQKQMYHCFGCGASGNIISFLMDYERLGFLDAIETLAQMAGVEIPTEFSDNQHGDQKKLYEAMQKAQQFYSIQLKKHPKAKIAQDYVQQRGLTSEIIERFKIGYAPEGWGNILTTLKQHHFSEQDLLDCGLTLKSEKGRVYDRFRHRIMFPIHDRRGRVIAFGGRVLSDEDNPKYLNSPETTLFHKGYELYGLYEAKQANRTLSRLLVVEGYMDVIALAQHGLNNAVATLGTAITPHHLQRLFRTTANITFCFDGDNAGYKAAWKALEIALESIQDNNQVSFFFIPRGDDPDSYVRKHGAEHFLKQIDQATSLSQFLFDHLSEQVNLETLDGRTQLASLTLPYINKVQAPILQSLLQEELANIAHTQLSQVQLWTSEQPPIIVRTQKNNPQTRQTPIRLAITLILHHPELITNIDDTDIASPLLPGSQLLQTLIDTLKTNPDLKGAALIEPWRNKPEFNHLMTLAHQNLLTPESGLQAELNDVLSRIGRLTIDKQVEQLMEKMTQGSINHEEKLELQTLLILKNKK